MAIEIKITALHDGVAVQFPKDRALIDRFKARFPKARWGSGTTSWHVPGKLAERRVSQWAAEEEAEAAKAARAAEDTRVEAEFERRPLPPEGAAYFAALKAEGRRMTTPHVSVRLSETELRIAFPYDPEAVTLARRANGRWDGTAKRWVFPLAEARRLHPVVDAIEAIVAPAAEREAAAKAAREAGWAKERAEAAAARQRARDERDAGSEVWMAGSEPRHGVPFLHRGKAVVAVRTSDRFRVDTDAHLVNGGGTLDVEWCVRVWLRDATEAEAAPLLADERQAKEDARVAAARSERVRATAAAERLASGRPIRVYYKVGMELCGQHGLGEADWTDGEYHPSRIERYRLSLPEARRLQDVFRSRAPDDACNEYMTDRLVGDLEREIAQVERDAAVLAGMSQAEHAEAAAAIRQSEEAGIAAVRKLWDMD